jgi:hypothetical protein
LNYTLKAAPILLRRLFDYDGSTLGHQYDFLGSSGTQFALLVVSRQRIEVGLDIRRELSVSVRKCQRPALGARDRDMHSDIGGATGGMIPGWWRPKSSAGASAAAFATTIAAMRRIDINWM